MIVLMAGLPASGKSTLSRELAARLDGTVLDKDKVRSAIFSPPDIEYSIEQDDFCMEIMLDAAAYVLQKNPARLVFLDGRTFSRTRQIERVLQFARAHEQEWRILECTCSEETARKRLAQQSTLGEHSAANRDYELYLTIKSRFEEIQLPKTVIDTDQSLEICMQLALQALS
jgi:predicted kinase